MVNIVTGVPRLPARTRDGHKGTFGTVLIVAGSHGMLGAAILAARAAIRGGAGLVRCSLPDELRVALTIAAPAATTLTREPAGLAQACSAADACVCGPGLGQDELARAALACVLASCERRPLVLDADALNLLAPLSEHRLAHAVLTPHPGEAARLLATSTAVVQADRERAALELHVRTGGVVVLKGAGTVVTDGESLFVNRTGNPGLGTGGSGDVLSGLLGALLAQGMSPFDAARCAVDAHGRAGDLVASRLSEAGLSAEDLPLAIAEVLSR